jgi:hypothetical protein
MGDGIVRAFASVSTRGGSPVLVGEYRYNGLGFQIGRHNDVSRSGGGDNPDGTVDSNDPWYFSAYDENWRLVAGSGSAAGRPAPRKCGNGHGSRQRCRLGG